jgi:hypothetical protein
LQIALPPQTLGLAVLLLRGNALYGCMDEAIFFK